MLNDKNKGFTLLELLVSIFILTVGILGAYVAIQKSIAIANYAYNRLMAAYLAQEGIEIVRNIKDTNLVESLGGDDDTWDQGLENKDYELQYTDVSNPDPNILRYCQSPCDFNSLTPLSRDTFYSYGGLNETKFKRKITVEVGTEIINIIATVYWKDGTKVREFTVWDRFYDWL